MIDRYTIKFAPAVSQRELEKALHDAGATPHDNLPDIKKMKARIEVVGDFDDLKKLRALLEALSSPTACQ